MKRKKGRGKNSKGNGGAEGAMIHHARYRAFHREREAGECKLVVDKREETV
jgi:hypothetical protein